MRDKNGTQLVAPPVFAVLGHPNEGKSAVVSHPHGG